MPIYSEDKIICLILFTDRLSANRLNGHSHYLTGINQEIAQCLEAILLYNQALERINRKII